MLHLNSVCLPALAGLLFLICLQGFFIGKTYITHKKEARTSIITKQLLCALPKPYWLFDTTEVDIGYNLSHNSS